MIITVDKMDHQGRGIAKIQGKIVFIPYALIGEKVEIKIVKEYAKYMEAEILKIITPSSQRIEPKCPYYMDCGGCNLQHLDYQEYLNIKKDQIKDIFKRYLSLDIDPIIIGNSNPYNYRNKISLKIENGKIGFYQNRSNKLIEIKECLIVDKNINRILKGIKIKNGNLVIRTNFNKELILIINSKDKIKFEELIKKYNIIGVIQNNKIIYGKDYLIEEINGFKFKINYNSFFQTNNYINGKLLEILNKSIPSNLNVLDLFCGVGSLGLSIANKSKTITGIEIIPEAILNTQDNAKLNNITNSSFICEDALKLNLRDYRDMDIIVVDPPRSGLNSNIIKSISSKYLIYISCDPMTLTRDLKELLKKYNIENLYVLDMFSFTSHVECFIKLVKKD